MWNWCPNSLFPIHYIMSSREVAVATPVPAWDSQGVWSGPHKRVHWHFKGHGHMHQALSTWCPHNKMRYARLCCDFLMSTSTRYTQLMLTSFRTLKKNMKGIIRNIQMAMMIRNSFVKDAKKCSGGCSRDQNLCLWRHRRLLDGTCDCWGWIFNNIYDD